MSNEDWDPTGYYTKKLEARRHGPVVVGVCIVAMIIIALVAVAFPAHAHEQGIPAGTKEKITEVSKPDKHACGIYRVVIYSEVYIVNTCGGIVKE